ncbi:hypothetical protein D3C80_758460 [compost metagenome]
MFFTQFQQLGGAGKIIRQHSAVEVDDTAGGLRFIDDKTAADRIVGVAMQLAVITLDNQGHGVGMEWQVLVDQAHVPAPDEGHRQATVEQQRVGLAQVGDTDADLRRINRIRPLAHQPHDHCIVAAVADTSGRQRAEQLDFDTPHLLKQPTLAQALHKQRRRPHGPHGVRTGRADADFEQVENTDSHYCRTPGWAHCARKNAR